MNPEIVDRGAIPPDRRPTDREHMAAMSARLAQVRAEGKRWKPNTKPPRKRGANLSRWNREHPKPRTKQPRPEYRGRDAVTATCQDCGREYSRHPRDPHKVSRCPECALARVRAWRPAPGCRTGEVEAPINLPKEDAKR